MLVISAEPDPLHAPRQLAALLNVKRSRHPIDKLLNRGVVVLSEIALTPDFQ